MKNLSEIIRGEIAVRGAIPFARFMELALYCPDTGFYEKDDDTVGLCGDFYTSVSVGSVFGELLAFQIADWLPPLPDQCGFSKLNGRSDMPPPEAWLGPAPLMRKCAIVGRSSGSSVKNLGRLAKRSGQGSGHVGISLPIHCTALSRR